MKRDDVVLLFPIKTLIRFLIFTEILYYLGPINYDYHAPILTASLLAICNWSLYIGYVKKIHTKGRFVNPQKCPARCMKIILIFGFLVGIIAIWRQTGGGGISPSSLTNKLIYALQNSGDVYHEKLENARTTAMTYFFMLLSPVKLAAMCFGIYFWKKMGILYKLVTISIILFDMFGWILSGTRKGILDNILLISCVIILANPNYLIDRAKKRKITITASMLVLIFLFYFVVSNLARGGKDLTDVDLMDVTNVHSIYADNLPSSIVFALSGIEGYLCQGYKALDIALYSFIYDAQIYFTYGFGNNWFFINLMEHLAPNIDILGNTYQSYLKHFDIDPMINWHSIYVWWANDVTFFGVPFVMYYIGRLCAKAWSDAYYGVKLSAIPLSFLLILMIFYSFANNQVLSFSMIPFVCFLFLYKTRLTFFSKK